jgi:hypothetical protein
VIGLEQQSRGIAEPFVEREPGGVGMAVRADDRQPGDLGIEFARERAYAGVGGEQAIGVQFELVCQPLSPACVLLSPIAMIALTGEEFRA